MDGVIADTGAIHFETWKTVMDDLGIPYNSVCASHPADVGNSPRRGFISIII